MTYRVKWDQWYREGPYGDDSDFDEKSVLFDSLEAAHQFANDISNGMHLGLYDRTVNRNDIKISKVLE